MLAWAISLWAFNCVLLLTPFFLSKAEIIKQGGTLAHEITHINKNKDESRDINPVAKAAQLQEAGDSGGKDLSWEKPDWTKDAGLKSTAKGTERARVHSTS